MALNHQTYRGLGYLPSYQASAVPYLTSSLTVPVSTQDPLEIKFDTVSRFVIITNTLDSSFANIPLRFGFSANGVKGVENNNFVILNNGESFEAEFRVSKVYLLSDSSTFSSSGSVVAGLTDIESGLLQTNWSGSNGVG
jgi:hypothetical protein